ncbi:MAG: LacI family DNA-binding transcriptional regulator [Phycisphaeraceae bacterium]
MESASGTTIAQIAKEAGVSIGTVSRVLNGKHKNAWPSAARRAQSIVDIAARLNYRPSWAARAMAQRKSHMVGVVVRNAPDRKFIFLQAFETMLGINDCLASADFMLSLVHLAELGDESDEVPRVFRENILDGMIVLGGDMPEVIERKLKRIHNSVAPCLWVENNQWRATGCLHRDEVHAAQLAVEQLAQAGYRKLIWVGPSADVTQHYSVRERERGVRETAEALGLPVVWRHMGREPYYDQLKALCRDEPLSPDTAILASGARHATTLALAAGETGRLLGRDLGLACCDDSQQISAMFPTLSRVSFDRYQLGVTAAQMLLATIGGDELGMKSRRVRGQWIAGTTASGSAAAPGSATAPGRDATTQQD